jgi:hypothetical protein
VSTAEDRTKAILAGYRDRGGIDAAIDALAAHPSGRAQVVEIGVSRGGHPIRAIRLGAAFDPAAPRPAILVAAGLDGLHLASSEIALGMAEALVALPASDQPDLLARATIWIIPRANPDALDATFRGPTAQRGTLRPVDDDRDGAADEDGPRDLDGDGVVVQMRVRQPKPPFTASLVVDPAEPRLLKRPEAGLKAGSIEPPIYAVFPEGLDGDGDGRIAEDGPGEVDLDRNFPHRWPEFARDAGPHQMSEPESKALADFVLAHREIAAALVLGRHDSVVKVPETRDMDATGRTPLVHLPADLELHQALGQLYRETTGQTRAQPPGAATDHAGSFWLWLANHRGILTFASTAWGRPDVPKPEAPKPAETPAAPDAGGPNDAGAGPRAAMGMVQDAPPQPAAQPAAQQAAPSAAQPAPGQRPRRRGGGGPPGGAPSASEGQQGDQRPAQQPSSDEDARWLEYSDAMRGGVGFIPWHEVEHPVFGTAEVGGFHPLFGWNPPAAELPAIAAKQVAFLAALVERFPKIVLAEPTVTPLDASGELLRIETTIANEGRLPTAHRMAVTTRARALVLASISTPVEGIVSGDKVRRIETLDSGERIQLAWIVRRSAAAPITIELRGAEFGRTTFTIDAANAVQGTSKTGDAR